MNPVGAPSFQTAIARQVPGASAQVIAPTMRSLVLPYVAALIAVVAAAATVALVVALSSSDMRPDLDTLDAIGAAPTMRRHVTTWQGVVLARVREIGVSTHVPLQTGKQGDVVFGTVEQRLAEQDFEGGQAAFVYIAAGAVGRMVLP